MNKAIATLFLSCAIPLAAQTNPIFLNSAFNVAPPAATPTFSPTSPYTGGATTVTASSTDSGICTMYFDASSTPATAQSTYSFTTTITLYAQLRGCTGKNNSAVATWVGTFVLTPAIRQFAFNTAACGSTTCAATLPSHTAGDYSCVLVASEAANTCPTSGSASCVVNTKGFTWTVIQNQKSNFGATDYRTQLIACAPTIADAVSDIVTVTLGAGNYATIEFVDVDNLTVGAVDNSEQTTGTSGTASCGTLSVSGPSDMLLAIANTVSTATWGGSINCFVNGGGVSPFCATSSDTLSGYKEFNTSTITPATTNSSTSWACLAVALK